MAIKATLDDQSLKDKMRRAIPDGQSIGNVSLRKKLKMQEDEYWRIRNLLIDEGRLTTGRGKGGSVRNILIEQEVANSTPSDVQGVGVSENSAHVQEREIYEPILKIIKSDWAREERLEAGGYFAEITAQQGRRITGGKWTRPDIVLGSQKRYRYVSSSFELVTFEVKTGDAFDVTAIYEALSHRRFSHKAYVLAHVENQTEQQESFFQDLRQEAERHGIGLIILEDTDDWEKWDIQVKALRHEPDPEKLNDFITQQVSEEFKDWLLKNRN